ncbi:kinase-like protein, partial [Sistotremastrum niveocremeum HHB9708]
SLVSPWMTHGTVMEYIEDHPEVDRVLIMSEICEGLVYLHAQDVIHGDLKGPNIFVSDRGHPVLADFGLSRLEELDEVFTTSSITSSSANPKGTTRYMAPEMFDSFSPKPSKATDIWALGCLMLEVIARILPYANCKKDPQVIHNIITKKPPYESVTSGASSSGACPKAWELCINCWTLNPSSRPDVAKVKEWLSDDGDDDPDLLELTTEVIPQRSEHKMASDRLKDSFEAVREALEDSIHRHKGDLLLLASDAIR